MTANRTARGTIGQGVDDITQGRTRRTDETRGEPQGGTQAVLPEMTGEMTDGTELTSQASSKPGEMTR